MCIPLSRLNQTLGVLAINATQANAFTDDDVATLTQLADFVSVAIGSACDLSRVSTQLLELSQPSATSSANASAGSASRYIASVLSPDTVTRIDSRQRIQRVLDDPAVLSMVFQPIVDLVTDEVASATIVRRPAATSGFANAAASLRSTQDC